MPGTRNRRDTLLTAALNSFTQRGYDATSVAELATATGMSKAAVSYHFRSKNDLLHAVADPLLDSLDALINRHPTTPHWPGGVRALLEDYLTTLTNHSQVAAWVDSDKAVLNHPQIGARLHHNTERMCQAITGSTADGTAATARATAALGSLWRPIRTLTQHNSPPTATLCSTPRWPAAHRPTPRPTHQPAHTQPGQPRTGARTDGTECSS